MDQSQVHNKIRGRKKLRPNQLAKLSLKQQLLDIALLWWIFEVMNQPWKQAMPGLKLLVNQLRFQKIRA